MNKIIQSVSQIIYHRTYNYFHMTIDPKYCEDMAKLIIFDILSNAQGELQNATK